MKKNKMPAIVHLAVFCCSLILFSGCFKDAVPKTQRVTYTLYTPIYGNKANVLTEINGDVNEPVDNTGKIYIKDNFIYLNEVDKGIHIIDNSDPAHPQQIAFLNIPGNLDIAVKGNTLYADMYSELLAIDITNPKQVTISSQLRGIFTNRLYVNGVYTDSSQIVTGWLTRDTTIIVDIAQPECINCYFDLAAGGVKALSSSSTGGNGVAGSMAAMVLINDYLYAITEMHTLGIINVSDEASPSFVSSMFAGFDLETIYPFEDKLFLGSAIGMFMYDVSDPEHPLQLGQFEHGRACDPVVTDGNYAYITLHGGTACGGDDNELNIVDIKNLMQPVLVKTYPMTKPNGLCKDGDLLFICDGPDGVKLYDAANAADIKLLKQIDCNEPYDIIAGDKKALVVAKDGLYQYDYSNLNNIRLISVFAL